jgi:hypothetical protein
MLSVIVLCVAFFDMLSVIMLCVPFFVKLSVIMLNIVTLNVVAPTLKL